ncbi:MAG: hypothetical protein NC452_10070 [Eubacterium sp.]|nr:hypothetical protein [Eubacterium sp.]
MDTVNEYSDFLNFLELLNPDTLFIPKGVVARRDISENSKFMCSIILTKHRFDSVKNTKEALRSCGDEDIRSELGDVNTAKIKADLRKIANDFESVMLLNGSDNRKTVM